MKDNIIVALITAGIFLITMGISWIATVGIVKLITLCFGWGFSWLVSTGIWLALFIIKSCFTSTSK